MTHNLNRWLLASLTLIVALTLSEGRVAKAQQPAASSLPGAFADWKTYTVKGEEFSVSLPAMPAMTTQTTTVMKLNKNRKQRVIAAYADGVVFAIFTFENPKRRQSIADLIAEGYGSREDRARRSLSVGGFIGKEYGFEEGDKKGVSQFYVTDRHIYLFQAVGSSLGNPDVSIPKFLSSIGLEKKPGGIGIDNGPGQQDPNPAKQTDNNQSRPVSNKDVTEKAIVITRPAPASTHEARKYQFSGTVVLQCVFSSSGTVTNIRPSFPQPFGLTERAIEAARQIKFIPAIKEGHFVSTYKQLEYDFKNHGFVE